MSLEKMEGTLEEIKEIAEDTSASVKRIEFHLYDDPKTGGIGLVSQVRSLERRIKLLEDNEIVRKAKAGVYGAIGSAVVMGIVGLVKVFIWLATKAG